MAAMSGKPQPERLGPEPASLAGPITVNAIVLVTLNAPREKFWGALLALAPAGLTVRGVDLNSFEDFARMVKAGDAVTPNAVFFPMHRVERVEADLRNGDIPSLRERFLGKTGTDPARLLQAAAQPEIQVGCTLEEARRRLIQATLAAVHDDARRAAEILDIAEAELR